MRIEVDTKHDTKEELGHLARMLLSMSGASHSQIVEKPKHVDMFSDDAPTESGGLFSMFGDNTEPAPQPEQPSGDMISLFDSSLAASGGTSEPEEEPKGDLVNDLKIVPY